MASALSREFLEDQVYSPWVPSAHPRPDACPPLCEISTCCDGWIGDFFPYRLPSACQAHIWPYRLSGIANSTHGIMQRSERLPLPGLHLSLLVRLQTESSVIG